MKNFEYIIGQEAVREHLQHSLALNKISQAYMLSGEDGMGKKQMAEAFAKALLCEEREDGGDESCGNCHSCKQVESHNHPDLIYVTHNKPQLISVDEIRQQVVGDVQIRPYQSKYKVYIIDEAELMNEQAQNALLKTIEEPPEYAVILLLTTNEQMMLQTVRSRCIKLSMVPLSDDQIMKALTQREHIPPVRAQKILPFARGNLGRAKELALSEEFEEKRAMYIRILSQLPGSSVYQWTDDIEKLAEDKKELASGFDLMEDWYRDVLLYKAGALREQLIYQDAFSKVAQGAGTYSFRQLQKNFEALCVAREQLKRQVRPQLILENLFTELRRTKE
ncbi:MAG: DNA polymerase III subunit delta' [Lachnospiraceae bacterium]|nr:DNA polymerase III subunit delta' [Lachnospiraceae bacterium]